MPRIKLTAIIAGPDFRGQPGEIIEVSHQDAARLIKAGAALPQEPFAETAELAVPPAADPAPAENAQAPAAPETAGADPVKKTGRRK
jgi:hypothetical protein